MKALILEQTGGVENLKTVAVGQPEVKSDEVLVEVKAISVNPVDYKVRSNENVLKMICGNERPIIIGWDISGVVVETGDEVSEFVKGDKVFGMVNFPGVGNAYAEFVASPEGHLAKIPDGISFEAAAASTLAALTALQVLKPKVKKNDKVLIHAGSGGVGHFAIQIAKALGAHVTTTGSAKNKDFIMSLGADQFIDYRTQNFVDVVSDLDFVFDMFNGEILLNSLKVVKIGGSIVSLPTPDFSDEILALAKEKQIDLSFQLVASNGADINEIKDLLASNKIVPHVSKSFAFDDMGEAHLHLESGRTVGKVVVTL